jgi:tRNA threonylcarbamoyladenosine biosynthesis protein TsaB
VRLLSIDTTGEHGSIALVNESSVLEEASLQSADGFAHILFDEIERLLARHGLEIGDITGFAAASGPGSFTGVRVGLTAVKGLAEATGTKVVAVSNLQALASYGTRPLRAVVMDARRGEIYGAVYNSKLEAVQPEVVMKLPDWLVQLPAGELEIVVQEPGIAIKGTAAPIVKAPCAVAGAIGRLAITRFERGEAVDPAEIDANYVRRSDAELFWREA